MKCNIPSAVSILIICSPRKSCETIPLTIPLTCESIPLTLTLTLTLTMHFPALRCRKEEKQIR